ncbi:MAG: pyruvate kinase [Gammaproteobacteria bacterium]|nr:pyruvate kinase [Gammaproteobacteria bacterium]MDE2345402.1 pyruvate kinase [Gammaproteobacteria bacterium]
MSRRTKIVATLGPATDTPEVMQALLRAGVDVVRLNLSHGKPDDHRHRLELVRAAAWATGKDVGVLADLQGPKIRIEKFQSGRVVLEDGQSFVLDAGLADSAGNEQAVGITYKALPNDVKSGDLLVLGDGEISLRVQQVEGQRIVCRVENGGELSDHKGVNRQGGGLSAKALTDKDIQDIKLAAELEVDYLAVSFPRDAGDIQRARKLMQAANSKAGIIAKIERSEAISNLDGIIQASDAVMIARGDLAVEVGDAELPGIQKHIIRRTRDLNRVVITATQMMESMIHSPVPTRAEVLDVANAVLDGTDAVMLSAETAAGKYPVKAVEAMARVCEGAERQRISRSSQRHLEQHFSHVDEAIAMAVMFTANRMDVKAIIALTESGSTALWMSRISSGIPIYAMTRHEATRRLVTLYRGVYPVAFDVMHTNPDQVLRSASEELEKRNIVKRGDYVICTKGEFSGVSGGTNSLKILRVGE